MKKIAFLFFAMILGLASFSQTSETITDYQKTQQPALENDIQFPEKTVDKAIEEKMQKMGYKGSSAKDYTVYKGVHAAEIGPDQYDLYFKTEHKGHNKNLTTVTLLISKGNEKFVSDTTDPGIVSNGKAFLNNLVSTVTAYDLEQQILDQEDVVKKNDKKMDNLVSDGHDLAKKQAKVQEEINDNSKDQASQQAELSRQNQILQTLISKRVQ